ncbi:MAG: LptA/OstA family protein [Nitrospira sp.]
MMFMWILFLVLSIVAPGTAEAVAPVGSAVSKSSGPAQAPTTITAKKMTVRNQDSQAIFEGSVVLTQGSLMVYSDKMVVSFSPQPLDTKKEEASEVKKNAPSVATKQTGKDGDVMPGSTGRSVKQIEATGHVRIEKETGNATSNKAVFDNSRRVVTLTGDPVAWEKGTRVSGEKIIIYLDEDRSVVEGGSHLLIDGESGGMK